MVPSGHEYFNFTVKKTQGIAGEDGIVITDKVDSKRLPPYLMIRTEFAYEFVNSRTMHVTTTGGRTHLSETHMQAIKTAVDTTRGLTYGWISKICRRPDPMFKIILPLRRSR